MPLPREDDASTDRPTEIKKKRLYAAPSNSVARPDQLAVEACLRDIAGIAIGVPVSKPLRACDRYQAAWVSLKADLGNSFLTAAIISSFVAALFRASVSITNCLMVCFGSAVGFVVFVVFAAGALPFLDCFAAFCCFLLFIVDLPDEWESLNAFPRA